VAGYSSDVQLRLIVAGREYALAQIGPDFVMLREPANLPSGDAEVVMMIDGRERRWAVTLEHGANGAELEVATVDR
jgi:hypothetical protein